jgi:hypothetical protein
VAQFKIMRNPWVDLAAPLVLFVGLFRGFLVMLGDSFGRAIAYSLTIGVAFTLLGWWRSRRAART